MSNYFTEKAVELMRAPGDPVMRLADLLAANAQIAEERDEALRDAETAQQLLARALFERDEARKRQSQLIKERDANHEALEHVKKARSAVEMELRKVCEERDSARAEAAKAVGAKSATQERGIVAGKPGYPEGARGDMLQVHKAALTEERNVARSQRDDALRTVHSLETKLSRTEEQRRAALTWIEEIAHHLPVGPLRSSAIDWVKDCRDEEIPF